MFNHYKITFTEDRKTHKTFIIPAQSVSDSYIIIQERFPKAEILEIVETNKVTEGWAQSIAKYMIAHASLEETCTLASYLDEEKSEELVNAIWDEWHKSKDSRAV